MIKSYFFKTLNFKIYIQHEMIPKKKIKLFNTIYVLRKKASESFNQLLHGNQTRLRP